MKSWLAAIALALFSTAGCAAPAMKMTFAEAGILSSEPDEAEATPPVHDPAPAAVATEAPQGPLIDPTLLRFATEARWRRGRHEQGGGFPPDAVEAWRGLAADLDRYLLRPLPQTPLLELVRARVTVEAEWDYDQRRYGEPPADLLSLVQSRAGRLSTRIETERAIGMALEARPTLLAAPLRWPVEKAGISSPFGVRIDPIDGSRRMHLGLDLVAEQGAVVEASARGWVVRAGPAGGYGLMVEVRHPGDLTTRYGHLSEILCAPGDAVEAGQPLGLVGQTGRATGPHLHFEVWKGGLASDPLELLSTDRVAGIPTPPGVASSGGPR
ncbi:MAG TPA: M23 family metallopeptidase [Anaeromyxobacter sp.]|nr:M23 family metallopeptidase [Anaeromyxobacter sp.]